MHSILQSAFIEPLGWALVDSLWQTGALWALYSLYISRSKKTTPSKKHNLALVTLVAGMLWFFITFLTNYYNSSEKTYRISLSYFFTNDPRSEIFGWLNNVMPYLVMVYLVTVAVYSLRLFFHFGVYTQAYQKSNARAPAILENTIKSIAVKLKITKKVRLWLSEKGVTPFTIGILKPVIFLPVSALTNLSSLQIEAVLVHELNHVKRNDYLLNFLLVICDLVLFFNPFAKLLSDTVRTERENSCDDRVISLGYDAWTYSQALYILGNASVYPNQVILAATGPGKKNLLGRIRRILKLDEPSHSILKPLCTFFLCLVVSIMGARNTKDQTRYPAVTANPELGHMKRTAVLTVVPLTEPQEASPTGKEITPRKLEKPIAVDKPAGSKRKEVENRGTDDEETTWADEIFHAPTFINDEQSIDFTIIIPELPSPQNSVTNECPLPYVPPATFYCPVDTLPTAVATEREIIHI